MSNSKDISYAFIGDLTKIMQSGSSRSILLSGNVQDLFFSKNKMVPLVDLLIDKFTFDSKVNIGGEQVNLAILCLDLNDGIKFLNNCKQRVVDMWVAHQIYLKKIDHLPANKPTSASKSILTDINKQLNEELSRHLREARNDNGRGLQILRRFVEAAQSTNGPRLLIIIEGADLVLPVGDIANLSPANIRKLAIMEDWLNDPDFLNDKNTIILIADSPYSIHPRISRFPQLVKIDVPNPDLNTRLHYLNFFYESNKKEPKNDLKTLAENTAAFSIHAIRQLLVEYVHDQTNEEIPNSAISRQLSVYITSQIGNTIKYFRPTHRLNDLRGNRNLKKYFREELIPRLISQGNSALSALIVAGAIRSGKTYIFEALAAEMDCPVLLLAEIRSSLYGGTDVIIDKLERLLLTIPKALVIVDEADVMLGRIKNTTHETENRLIGRIQAIISNSELIGRITWVLMTARIDNLSPDLKGEGRGGDLIIPILDPVDDDLRDFIQDILSVAGVSGETVITSTDFIKINEYLYKETCGWYAGRFGSLRRAIYARKDRKGILTADDIVFLVNDTLSPDIYETRRYQELQALMNCTSRSLLPPKYQELDIEKQRTLWKQEIETLKYFA